MKNIIGQLTYREILAVLSQGISKDNVEYYKTLLNLRKCLIQREDSRINLEIENREITLNLSHCFPLYRKMYPLYDTAIRRLASMVRVKKGNLKMIDVGANIGDTLLMVQPEKNDVVLCIEGNRFYYDLFSINVARWNLESKIIIENVFLGEKKEKLQGKVLANQGTGKIEIKENGEDITIVTLDEIISKHEFSECNLLKVDTDGFDYSVIRGSKDLLEKSHPMIFFEFDPNMLIANNENPYSIFEFLKNLNYERFFLYNNYGLPMGTANLNDRNVFEQIVGKIDGSSIGYYDILACHDEENELFVNFIKNEELFIKNCM